MEWSFENRPESKRTYRSIKFSTAVKAQVLTRSDSAYVDLSNLYRRLLQDSWKNKKVSQLIFALISDALNEKYFLDILKVTGRF